MDEARDQAVELEAAVEAPGEAGEIAAGMVEADAAIGAGDGGLDVAERGVTNLLWIPLTWVQRENAAESVRYDLSRLVTPFMHHALRKPDVLHRVDCCRL